MIVRVVFVIGNKVFGDLHSGMGYLLGEVYLNYIFGWLY